MTTHSQPVLPLYDPLKAPGSLDSSMGGGGGRKGGGGGADSWVLRQLPFYEDQYTSMNAFECCVTTFNAGCRPPPDNLNDVLGKSFRVGGVDRKPDILVVGLQEVDMSAAALWKEETDMGQLWIQKLKVAMQADYPPNSSSSLSPAAAAASSSTSSFSPVDGGGYFALPARQLVGLLTAVFVKKDVFAQGFKDYSLSVVSTGAGGNLGNKGCVGVRFQFHMSAFCFLNCHLAAGQGNVSKRNDDIQNILGRIDFCGANSSASALASSSGGSAYSGGGGAADAVGALSGVPTSSLYPDGSTTTGVDELYSNNSTNIRSASAAPQQSLSTIGGGGGFGASPSSPVGATFTPSNANAFREPPSSFSSSQRVAGGSIPPGGGVGVGRRLSDPPSHSPAGGGPSSGVGGGGGGRFMLLPSARMQYLSAPEHDIVVVFGDLNYRVDMGYDEAVNKAHSADFDGLLLKDQLLHEMRNPHTPFKGFTDHTPRGHKPTYRYDIGTLDTYDTSEKRRIPAYTDRVLHWARNKRHMDVQMRQLEVRQHVVCSDHKPVVVFFSLPFRQMVEEQRLAVLDRLREKVRDGGLDRVSAVKLRLSSKTLNFGIQSPYSDNDERKQTLVCTNEGECVAVIRTSRMATEGDESEGKWIRCAPRTFSILPGDSKEVEIECILDEQSMEWQRKWCPYRGAGERVLKSMVIINVENGPLSAIECTVRVRPSLFYNSILNLVNLEDKACVDAYADGGMVINTDGTRSRTTSRGTVPNISNQHLDPMPTSDGALATAAGRSDSPTGSESSYITVNNGSAVGAQRVPVHNGSPLSSQRMPTDAEVSAYRSEHSPESVGERLKKESLEHASRLKQFLPKIPKEVWYLCDALCKRASHLKGVFNDDPDLTVVKAIMDHLDTAGDKPIPPHLASDTVAVGYVLLELLNTLADPVVPFALYSTALNASKYANKVPVYIVHEQLPTYHSNVFIYLVGFMRHIIRPQFARVNELSAETLAKVFAPAMLRRPLLGPGSASDDRRTGKSTAEIRAIAQLHSMDAVKFIHFFLKPAVLQL